MHCVLSLILSDLLTVVQVSRNFSHNAVKVAFPAAESVSALTKMMQSGAVRAANDRAPLHSSLVIWPVDL